MAESPPAWIVIPTRNNVDTMGAVLDAALPQAPVFVVDDDSEDGTADLASRKGARLITVHKRSAAHARNVGWDAALAEGARFVLFLDADAVPHPDWAARLVDRLGRGETAIVGGDIETAGRTRVGRGYARMYSHLDRRLMGADSEYLPGMNLGVVASIPVRFDDTLPGAMCEDVDFLIRAKAAGLRIAQAPDAIVTHWGPQSFRELVQQEVRHGEGRAILLRKHPDRGGDSMIRSWPGWVAQVTVRGPLHWEYARRRAGFDPLVMILHHTRMAAGDWGFVREYRRPGSSKV
ncbi:MAG: glycosyltransferase [Thermoplasmatota archaeon]